LLKQVEINQNGEEKLKEPSKLIRKNEEGLKDLNQ
jgi:hypothetical protein